MARTLMAVTSEMVAGYAEITGDYNPLHFDSEFVAKTRFKRLICQGGITTGLLRALVAMDMPGAGTVFTSQRWSFPRPVLASETPSALGRR
jgi:acyl dehydratase